MDPHDPYTPPAALRPPAPPGVRPAVAAGQADPLARRLNAPGGSALAAVEVEHLRRLYDAEIRAWDAELGTLLDTLAGRGLADSTIVVLTADHGEEFQEHGRLKHRIHLYDELLHVPLVIAGRSEERRVGKECRSRWWPDQGRNKGQCRRRRMRRRHCRCGRG